MMFITTILASLAFLMAYDANVFLVIAFFLFFGFIDTVYLSANLEKVGTLPHCPSKCCAMGNDSRALS